MKTLLFFLLATLPCYAGLGETEAQCITRYDAPVATLDDCGRAKTETFIKKGFYIMITFLDGTAVSVTYRHPWDITDVHTFSSLTQEEINDLLAANSDGKTWAEQPPSIPPVFPEIKTVWKRDGDGWANLWQDSHGSQLACSYNKLNREAIAIIAAAKAKKTTDGL
jgi:hypothetical protein